MTLQLPVEGGHEGGRVVVRHRSDEHLFDSSASSSSHFYLTASYSDCGLEFEEVTVGWRLAIVIGLTPEFPVVPVVAPLPCFPGSLIHRSVTRIIETWAQLPPSPLKYLLIPFRHRYDPDVYLDLNGLKGRDKSWFITLVTFPVEVRIVLIRNEVPAGYAVERPGILIWPKGQPMDAALISGFMGELDLLRDPPDLATMHQLVNYCVRNPWCVTSEDDDRSNRLFALCLQLESGVEGLRLLSVYASRFFFEGGVMANELALAIGKILTLVDLETCSGVVELASSEVDREFTDKYDALAAALLEADQMEYGHYLTLEVATRRGGDD